MLFDSHAHLTGEQLVESAVVIVYNALSPPESPALPTSAPMRLALSAACSYKLLVLTLSLMWLRRLHMMSKRKARKYSA